MQQATAKQTDIKMPARKLRRVINEVRGKMANEALRILKFYALLCCKSCLKRI